VTYQSASAANRSGSFRNSSMTTGLTGGTAGGDLLLNLVQLG
jgi:hypothetical protein